MKLKYLFVFIFLNCLTVVQPLVVLNSKKEINLINKNRLKAIKECYYRNSFSSELTFSEVINLLEYNDLYYEDIRLISINYFFFNKVCIEYHVFY
jgi:hypothetical protein